MVLEEEQPLCGGRTALSVVRIADTVRRTPSPNDEFARALLLHLEQQGFDAAPRFLGVDSAGRRVLSYVSGEVPAELGHFEDEALVGAARLIRRYHDATTSLFSDSVWRSVGIDVAAHNDLSPCNTVFRAGTPIALIDFDAAAPGTRIRDLGYVAWLWLDIGNVDLYSPGEQGRRLKLFVESYGSPADVRQVARAAIDRQNLVEMEGMRLGKAEMTRWAVTCRASTEALVELFDQTDRGA